MAYVYVTSGQLLHSPQVLPVHVPSSTTVHPAGVPTSAASTSIRSWIGAATKCAPDPIARAAPAAQATATGQRAIPIPRLSTRRPGT